MESSNFFPDSQRLTTVVAIGKSTESKIDYLIATDVVVRFVHASAKRWFLAGSIMQRQCTRS